MTPTSVAVLPDELIKEILSFLPVNSLLRFRCVCKYWKALISDPSFVKLHLNKSQTRNPLFTLITLFAYTNPRASTSYDYSVVPYSLRRLIENPPFNLTVDPYYHLSDKGCSHIVGTCNGLILLARYTPSINYFRLWNPATRTISPNFGHVINSHSIPPDPSITFLRGFYRFTFCCDDSTDTYKIVAFGSDQRNVRILSLGHNIWREIHSGRVDPLRLNNDMNDIVYFCNTLNWMAINGDTDSNITVEQFFKGDTTNLTGEQFWS